MTTWRPPSAQHIAALIIRRQHEAGHTVDKMQLEKLLYLVAVAHFALWGRKAFTESIKAFDRGPVVANVEASYRPGPMLIENPLGDDAKVPSEVRSTVTLVLQHFGSWPAIALERFVKGSSNSGSPWRRTRDDNPDVKDAEINEDLILGWARTHGVAPNPPTTDRNLAEAAAQGDAEAFAELLA